MPIFFWKPNQKNGYLSNWFITRFKENGIIFKNAEQYMMYHKALLFEDHVIANKILLESNPANVKKLGRQVKNFTIPKWTKHSDNIVYNGCLLKFSQNIYLKKQLLETKNELLAEASPYDIIWGIGLIEKDAIKYITKSWNFPGENKLGKCLMKVRETLSNKL